MPPTGTDEGIRAAQHLRSTAPQVGVVVLSQHVESALAIRLFIDGSEGRAYLLKERVGDVDELAHALRTVANGGSVIDPLVVEALVGGRSRNGASILERLTEREREVLGAMAAGESNVAIGEQLFISPRSVEKHISSIFSKLGLPPSDETHRRVQAVLIHLGEDSP
jgi:DNA-binding NarL/FixJ family response regulator